MFSVSEIRELPDSWMTLIGVMHELNSNTCSMALCSGSAKVLQHVCMMNGLTMSRRKRCAIAYSSATMEANPEKSQARALGSTSSKTPYSSMYQSPPRMVIVAAIPKP